MKKFIIAGLAVLLTASPAAAQREKPAAAGLWKTENGRSVIEIARCKSGLCGYIHWITEGGMQTDSKNPDPSKRNTPMCDLPIMWDFKQTSETEWTGGTIYKADEGDTYSSNMKMLPDGNLLVRGYVGMPMFGKSQIWTRVSAKDYPSCKKG